MENLGEIMKSCFNCRDKASHNIDCLGCVAAETYINWKPDEEFKPIPMQEIKVEDYEVKSQADGLVQLMSKVNKRCQECEYYADTYIIDTCCRCDISLSKFKPLIKPLGEFLEEESCQKVGVDSPKHPANQELLPELKEVRLEQIQNYNNTTLKQLAKPHGRTHYYKFTLDFCEDYSIRFFLEFSDRKDYEGNWYLKSHKLKEHSLLSKDMAEDLIRKSCTTFVEEIVGRRSGKKYEKIVVSKDKLVKFVE